MEKIFDFILDKGPIIGGLLGVCFCLGLIIWGLAEKLLSYVSDRIDKLFERLNQYEEQRDKDTAVNKKMSSESIQTVKIESNLVRVEMESLRKNLEGFKGQIAKQMIDLTAHATDAQNASSNSLKQMKEAMDKVGRVLELKDKLDLTAGNLKVVEVKIDRLDQHHRHNMSQVAEAIGKHTVEISNIKKGKP